MLEVIDAGLEPLTAQPQLHDELADLKGSYGRDDAALFLAWDGDLPLATVAVRGHDDDTMELERKYVRPVGRGRGVGRTLLLEAVASAADTGSRLVWLETLRASGTPPWR